MRACTALRKRSANGLVNAVLRNFLRRRESVLRTCRSTEKGRWSYPQWWIDELRVAYPDQYADILASGQYASADDAARQSAPDALATLSVLLQEAGIDAEQVGPCALMLERPVPSSACPAFAKVWYRCRILSAQYAAPLLDLAAGQRVLDACAAPGGKTAHIAECCDVALTAIDNDAQRLTVVAETFERLRLSPTAAACGRRRASMPGGTACRSTASCSTHRARASGIVRRHPDIKWLRRARTLPTLAASSAGCSSALWHTLAAGGKLLYATCSVFPAENQLQIVAFLQAHPEATLLVLPGIAEIGNIKGQLLPDSRHDGFFYALLQKD